MRPAARLVRLLLRLLFVGAIFACIVGAGVLWWLARDLPDPEAALATLTPAGPTARIYDRDGTLLWEPLPALREAGQQETIALERFPTALLAATLATEDAGFYAHPGIDWRGILRAARTNWRAGQIAAGGSTITQQVSRMLLLPPEERAERTVRRKLREAIQAIRLERALEKDDILALYLNHVYYGNLAYGAQGAARNYFGKNVWELSTGESALLAGLPQAPALYDPLVDPEAALARRAEVLRLMRQSGTLDAEGARLAADEPLRLASSPFPIEAPHFVMWVLGQIERQFPDEIAAGHSLRVVTTLELPLQHQAERGVRHHLERLDGNRAGELDRRVTGAALVAIDPATGDVLAMVGSPDFFDPARDGAVNVALMPRQPGSALKPFTYATAFDPARTETPLSPATVLADVPSRFRTGEGKWFEPHNYDRGFHGPMSLRAALATSNNVIAVRVLEHVGIEPMIRTARDAGIRSLTDPDRYDLTVTLGGGEVTLLELTNAYATLAAEGTFRPARAILRVEREDGTPLWEAPEPAGRAALDPRVVALVTDILADPLARAPAFGEYNALRLPFPAAAKSGTTTDWHDNWTVGYTPGLAVGVWVGNADNTPMRAISGVDGAGPIWNDVMKRAHRGTRAAGFPLPAGIVRREICAASGLLPGALCPDRRLDLFLSGHEPLDEDRSYRQVRIDEATGLLAAPGCVGPVVERLYRIPPPEAMLWARERGWPFPPTVPCDAARAEAESSGLESLRLLTPADGARFSLDPTLPAESQRLAIQIVSEEIAALEHGTLLLDDRPLATIGALPAEIYWPLEPGTHRLQAIGVTRDGRALRSDVVEFRVRGP